MANTINDKVSDFEKDAAVLRIKEIRLNNKKIGRMLKGSFARAGGGNSEEVTLQSWYNEKFASFKELSESSTFTFNYELGHALALTKSLDPKAQSWEDMNGQKVTLQIVHINEKTKLEVIENYGLCTLSAEEDGIEGNQYRKVKITISAHQRGSWES